MLDSITQKAPQLLQTRFLQGLPIPVALVPVDNWRFQSSQITHPFHLALRLQHGDVSHKRISSVSSAGTRELHIPGKKAIFIFSNPIPANDHKLGGSESSLFRFDLAPANRWPDAGAHLSPPRGPCWRDCNLEPGFQVDNPRSRCRTNRPFERLLPHSPRELLFQGGLSLLLGQREAY